MKYMQQVYQAFINNGYSPNQARAITAEVGRENGFNPKYLFGRHQDAANGLTNLGMISWQGARARNLDKELREQGLIDKNGNIERSQRSLDAMAKFLTNEIKTNKAYEETYRKFLKNPNVDYATANRVLGKNFIRWDYAGKHLGKAVANHHARRDKYYSELGGLIGNPNHQVDSVQTANNEPVEQNVVNQEIAQSIVENGVVNRVNPDLNFSRQQLVANNTDIAPIRQEAPSPIQHNFLEPTKTSATEINAPIAQTDRGEQWRIQTLEFDEDPLEEKLAAAFGAFPDMNEQIPENIAVLMRGVFDQV